MTNSERIEQIEWRLSERTAVYKSTECDHDDTATEDMVYLLNVIDDLKDMIKERDLVIKRTAELLGEVAEMYFNKQIDA